MTFLPPDPVFTFSVDYGPVYVLEFAKQSLLLGSFEGQFVLWDLECNKEKSTFKAAEDCIIAINQPSDKLLITQEKLGLIKLWSVDNLKSPITGLRGALTYCKSILYNNYLVTSHDDPRSIQFIDPFSLKVIKVVKVLNDSANFGQIMCFKSFESCLFIGFENGQVVLYHTDEDKQITTGTFSEFITSIDFDANSRRGIISNSSTNLELFVWQKGELIKRGEIPIKNEGSNCVRIRNDRKILVSGGWDGRVRVYSWKTLRPLAVLTEHNQSICDVKFSNQPITTWDTNHLMAVSSLDGIISLWNIYN